MLVYGKDFGREEREQGNVGAGAGLLVTLVYGGVALRKQPSADRDCVNMIGRLHVLLMIHVQAADCALVLYWK